MIIFTKELCDKRAEARATFGNCEFLPGDQPPIGRSVLTSSQQEAIVYGEYPGNPDGTCKYWWILKTKNGQEILDWPPTLRSI